MSSRCPLGDCYDQWRVGVTGIRRTCTHGSFTSTPSERKIKVGPLAEGDVPGKSDKQLARVATNLAIGGVGLIVVRLITQFLPMFRDAG